MDRRLFLELLPGLAFLAGHVYGGLFWAAGLSVVATALAVGLRWRWDRAVPWLAVATFVLILVLTGAGLVLGDETFVMLRPTVGALAFAAILAVGACARPSLLQRTLDYKLRLVPRGWPVLHGAWVCLALLAAGANEIARRALSTDHWVVFNVLSDPALFGLIWIATRLVAEVYWDEEEDAPAPHDPP
ncbi:intracellular septation protein A [Dinoroseobacter shibae DFL 12 = DSM 16493]|jgi:intracellular septation protein|uniref:Intracellular septation protein A n=1 Tax=Dinoroseobacter shibae (strain DSM 16493 / NCIMB 14021 / DFL 12) TaxID=398580 RepID=A8LSF4_DINSH|nr:septation protein IspZ [Dinoroseobacter shibae]ABV92768.1 intracellular septation protein A [Dinoroseobacter shibae DFL 12 = DSM 16493]URF47711.1 septation protein IspZ [Dinoroseobacter shibae]URF52021.1 septation protein IspZ [Dinoroseobacter shibae]